MKILKYVLIVPILFGCNSKNNSIEVLKANAKSYTEVSNSAVYRSSDAIVYFTFKGNDLYINLIDKSDRDELSVVECSVENRVYTPIEISSQDVGRHYKLTIYSNKKRVSIECKLSNAQSIKKSLDRYWK